MTPYDDFRIAEEASRTRRYTESAVVCCSATSTRWLGANSKTRELSTRMAFHLKVCYQCNEGWAKSLKYGRRKRQKKVTEFVKERPDVAIATSRNLLRLERLRYTI